MKVCVFGAGNMGARITEVFLNAGHDVTMIDIKPEFTERGPLPPFLLLKPVCVRF